VDQSWVVLDREVVAVTGVFVEERAFLLAAGEVVVNIAPLDTYSLELDEQKEHNSCEILVVEVQNEKLNEKC